jgi:hypothetical protein
VKIDEVSRGKNITVVRRVRRARHQLLSSSRAEWARFRRPQDAAPEPIAGLVEHVTAMPEGPHKLATILSEEVRQLSVMDRYERRALSRRKFAIRAFDLAQRPLARDCGL